MRQPSPSLFHGRHFGRSIIILYVGWYVTYKLSHRDLVGMMAGRRVAASYAAILRWGQRFVPVFEKRWGRYARPVGTSWRVGETYARVRGRWTHLYRAVGKRGGSRLISCWVGTEIQQQLRKIREGRFDTPAVIAGEGARV